MNKGEKLQSQRQKSLIQTIDNDPEANHSRSEKSNELIQTLQKFKRQYNILNSQVLAESKGQGGGYSAAHNEG